MSVKKEESLDLIKSQGPISNNCVYLAECNWEYLDLKKIYELVAFFGIDYIDFIFFIFLFGFTGVFGKKYFFLFFFFFFGYAAGP
jgi:hypothetical protein